MQQFRDTVAFSVLQSKLVQKLTSGLTVSDKQALDYYNKNSANYTQPESRDVAHILVATKAKAQSIYNQLVKGASFAALAKKYSTDTGSAVKGGDLGVQPETGARAVVRQGRVRASRRASLSKPTKSQFGWHIIKALGPVIPKTMTPFAKVKASIVTQIKQAKNSDVMSKFQSKLTAFYANADQVRAAATRRRPPRPWRRRHPPRSSRAVEPLRGADRARRRSLAASAATAPGTGSKPRRRSSRTPIEEAYEVADAAMADDDAKLLDELGDLLFQVYFLSLLLEETRATVTSSRRPG